MFRLLMPIELLASPNLSKSAWSGQGMQIRRDTEIDQQPGLSQRAWTTLPFRSSQIHQKGHRLRPKTPHQEVWEAILFSQGAGWQSHRPQSQTMGLGSQQWCPTPIDLPVVVPEAQ